MGEREPSQGYGGGYDYGSSRGDQGDWGPTWTRFFQSTLRIVKFKSLYLLTNDEHYVEERIAICSDIIEQLNSKSVVEEVPIAVEEAIREIGEQGPLVLGLLQREIIAITERNNRLIESQSSLPDPVNMFGLGSDAADEAITDTKTGKDSLEHFVGKKFTKNRFVEPILKVLNEILSLMKGGF